MASQSGFNGTFPETPTVPCCECGQPAIATCPHCKKRVHQDYGYNGANCSGRHEGKCDGARKSRERDQKPPEGGFPVEFLMKPGKNGVHKSAAKKGR